MSKVSVSFDTMEPEPSSATPVSEGALEESYEKFYRGVPGAMTVKEGDRSVSSESLLSGPLRS